MIKVEAESRGFIASRAIGSGFESVLFSDCRTAAEAQECVNICRADTGEGGGTFGVATRRFSYMGYGGSPEYVKMVNDTVVVLMIEKKSAVDEIEEILAIDGVDMIQWGPGDFSMNTGRMGQHASPEVKAVEREIIAKALKLKVHPRAEINSPDQAKYYLDLGVNHFCIGTDIAILHDWWKQNGDELRTLIS
jgi:2-keto-3-deoxy-L-rhamnonate aldolase RhmA